MWIIGAIIAAADLFGTMIGLAEVWIKGAISTAVILFVFAAPYLVVRKVKRLIRKARAVKEFDSGRELGRAVRENRVSEHEVRYKIDVVRTSAAKIMGVAVELCPERLPGEVFDGPTGDIKVDGPLAHQVYDEELSEWCAYGDVREGRLSEDDVRGEFEQGRRRVPRSWLGAFNNDCESDGMTDPQTVSRRRELVKSHLLDEHLIAIGHVAIRSSMLDTMIDFTVEALSKSYPKIMRDTSLNWPVRQKLDLIKQEITKLLPKHECAIAEFAGEIKAARNERADVMHRMWGTTDTDEEKMLIELRDWTKQKRPPKRTTAAEMMTLANKMIDLMFELVDWTTLSDCVRLRQSVPPGINPSFGPLPDPPRTSSKDEDREKEIRRQSRQRMRELST
jgi:hypothetical protein